MSRQICHPYPIEVSRSRPRVSVLRLIETLTTGIEKGVERKGLQNWLTVHVSRMGSPPMLFESGMFDRQRRFIRLGQLTNIRPQRGWEDV